MRRAERLFQIIQILRRSKSIVRACELAEELEVSERTIYRDIAALKAERVPIDGEAGIGYRLGKGYDLPPLMFTQDELEALLIGARIVQTWADPELGRAADDLLAKIRAVLPRDLRPRLDGLQLVSPPSWRKPDVTIDVARVRAWLHQQQKLRLSYQDEKGRQTERDIRPLTLAFYPPVWLLLAWCELRNDFRVFRIDRIIEAEFLQDRFGEEPGKRLVDYLKLESAHLIQQSP